MKKISTLYKKDPQNLGRVINEVNPENEWVFNNSLPTRKFDGTAVAIIDGELYKRYDVKKGRPVPANGVPCQEPDSVTGHWPHWVKCNSEDKADMYFIEAFGLLKEPEDGTYELVGPRVQGNPENYTVHTLVKHGEDTLVIAPESMNFDGLRTFLEENDVEGIVFYATDDTGRMCKIRKSDYGIRRQKV